jgi:hypothetical protein
MAKQNLTRSFRVVGLCERFQESLLLMRASFGWEVPLYENRKVAKNRAALKPDVIDAIGEHNAFAKKFFKKACAGTQAQSARG